MGKYNNYGVLHNLEFLFDRLLLHEPLIHIWRSGLLLLFGFKHMLVCTARSDLCGLFLHNLSFRFDVECFFHSLPRVIQVV